MHSRANWSVEWEEGDDDTDPPPKYAEFTPQVMWNNYKFTEAPTLQQTMSLAGLDYRFVSGRMCFYHLCGGHFELCNQLWCHSLTWLPLWLLPAHYRWALCMRTKFLCDSWWASGLFNIAFLGQLDQRSRNSSGIRTGIVPSAFSGYCTDLTATPAWVRMLPGSSPIKMCRNAERGKTSQSWIHMLRSLPQCGVHTATATWVPFIHLTMRPEPYLLLFCFFLKTNRATIT